MSHVPHPSRRVDRRLRRRLEMQAQEEENRDDDEDDGRDELVCDSHEEGQLLLLQQECTSLVERLEKYECVSLLFLFLFLLLAPPLGSLFLLLVPVS